MKSKKEMTADAGAPMAPAVEEIGYRVEGETLILTANGADRFKISTAAALRLFSGEAIRAGVEAVKTGAAVGFDLAQFITASRYLKQGLKNGRGGGGDGASRSRPPAVLQFRHPDIRPEATG